MLAARRALQFNDHNRRAQEILAELAGKSSAAIELEWRRRILRQNPATGQLQRKARLRRNQM